MMNRPAACVWGTLACLLCVGQYTAQAQSHQAVALVRSPAEQRAEAAINKILAQTVTVPTRSLALQDVPTYLRRFGLPVDLDVRAIEEEGQRAIDDREQIPGGTVTLDSWLDVACRNLGVTWAIRHERLWITTIEASWDHPEVRMFDVTGIVKVPPSVKSQSPYWQFYGTYEFDTLIELLEGSIYPDTWESLGGIGNSRGIVISGRAYLVVSQAAEVIRAVDRAIAHMSAVGTESGSQGTRRAARKSSLPKTTRASLRRVSH